MTIVMDTSAAGIVKAPAARRVMQRVKAGCRSCKVRRIKCDKCDEYGPFCWHCVSTGRECEGCGIWRGGGHPSRLAAQCLSAHRPSNIGLVARLGAQDRCVLSWFLASHFNGVFPFPFWEVLVPQACQSEPLILSCVLALGAAHKRAYAAGSSQSDVRDLDLRTLKHYNAAIHLLNQPQPNGHKASTRVTLMACLTFVIIDYLQKREGQGLFHLQHGLQILQSEEYKNIRQQSQDPADDWITESFGRLDSQFRLLSNATGSDQVRVKTLNAKRRAVVIKSLHDARQQLDAHLSEVFRLQRQGRNAEASNGITSLFQTLSIQQELQKALASWLQAYRAWGIGSQPCSVPEQIARHLLLTYHRMACVITAAALYYGDEAVFDQHVACFSFIISSAKRIAEMVQQTASTCELASRCAPDCGFTTDMGLIPPLYYTALKCRHPNTRQEALSALAKHTCREGIWDGPTAALIVTEVTRLEKSPREENGLEEQSIHQCEDGTPSESHFPRPWRISDVKVELPCGPETELVIICSRKLQDGSWTSIKRTHNGAAWY